MHAVQGLSHHARPLGLELSGRKQLPAGCLLLLLKPQALQRSCGNGEQQLHLLSI